MRDKEVPRDSESCASFYRFGTVRLADAQRLELAMQRRTLHADEFGGTRDVAAKPVDLRAQVFSLEQFARIAQRQTHQVLPTRAVWEVRYHGADVLRQHRGVDDRIAVTTSEDHQPFDVVTKL